MWVWVNVVRKKKFSKKIKKIKKIKKQKVVKFIKGKSPRTWQSYSPSPRSAKQIGSLRYSDYGLRLRINMLLRMIKTM